MANPGQKSPSIDRSYGIVFADAVTTILTSTTSPLLDHVHDSVAANDGATGNEPSETSCLQPAEPDPQQTLTYNAFCQSILDSCRDEVYTQDHVRSGVLPTDFEPHPNTGSPDLQLAMDSHPVNPSFFHPGVSKIGEKELIDQLAESIRQNRVKDMARLFLRTCPNDWNRDWGPSTTHFLESAIKGTFVEEEPSDPADTVRFRWELALMCDHIVHAFGLAVPSGQICLLWDDLEWAYEGFAVKSGCYGAYMSMVLYLLSQFPHVGRDSQGPPFTRPVHYIAAAITETNPAWDVMKAKADEIISFTKSLEANYQDLALKNANVVECGRNWFKAIGKRIG